MNVFTIAINAVTLNQSKLNCTHRRKIIFRVCGSQKVRSYR